MKLILNGLKFFYYFQSFPKFQKFSPVQKVAAYKLCIFICVFNVCIYTKILLFCVTKAAISAVTVIKRMGGVLRSGDSVRAHNVVSEQTASGGPGPSTSSFTTSDGLCGKAAAAAAAMNPGSSSSGSSSTILNTNGSCEVVWWLILCFIIWVVLHLLSDWPFLHVHTVLHHC